ncbi:MAG: stage 0 sporulation protein [Candidatus Hydrogenedentes bacterium]|nr:stage 0 sporulation protein [Candidatus Hydrogenedentota bacterium]
MNIARIRLRKPRRVLAFLCGDIVLRRDEPVIVETDQGLEWGWCVLPPEPCSSEMEEKISLRVVRKATFPDEESFHTLDSEEKKALELCRKRIEKRNLAMQLVDVQYTFDRHKVTFFFTAENRVDFRELVRDLAHELHSRIELRHIQVRDRSKLVGGLGTCGRPLCCAHWLEAFIPISMRMAKCQNLSLNPGKISGQCGRLLCCLHYENEVYERGDLKPAKISHFHEGEEEGQVSLTDEEHEGRPNSKSFVVKPPPAPENRDDPRKNVQADAQKAGNAKKKHKKKRNKKPDRRPATS